MYVSIDTRECFVAEPQCRESVMWHLAFASSVQVYSYWLLLRIFVRVGFVVDKLSLGKIFSQELRTVLVHNHHFTNAACSSIISYWHRGSI